MILLTDWGLLSALWRARDGSFWDRSATARVLFRAPPVTGVSDTEDETSSVSDTSSLSKYDTVFYTVGSWVNIKATYCQGHIH